jgi:hypothetical protein
MRAPRALLFSALRFSVEDTVRAPLLRKFQQKLNNDRLRLFVDLRKLIPEPFLYVVLETLPYTLWWFLVSGINNAILRPLERFAGILMTVSHLIFAIKAAFSSIQNIFPLFRREFHTG